MRRRKDHRCQPTARPQGRHLGRRRGREGRTRTTARGSRRRGRRVQLLSLKTGEIQAREHDLEPAGTFPVDRAVADASVDEFDALMLPGGTANPDKLRLDESAVTFVRDFVRSGKPVAAICHGPWTLVEPT